MPIDNPGVVQLHGDAASLPRKTIVVLGAPRGGTSMAAGVLSRLGVFMGEADRIDEPFYGHRLFLSYLKSGDKRAARKLAREYDERYPVWGFKAIEPRLFRWLGIFKGIFTQPVYVVVLRDVLAVASRRNASVGASAFREMIGTSLYYVFILLFLRLARRPAFLFSYEKALLFPEKFVSSLQDFLGLHDPEFAREAVRYIQPSPKSYTNRAFTNASMDDSGEWFGYVDFVEEDRIAGWVLNAKSSEPIEVRLKVNGQVVKNMPANLPRPDVAQSDQRYRQDCGFEFLLEETDRLAKGDEVDIEVGHAESPKMPCMPRLVD